jgi:hypothetical protein
MTKQIKYNDNMPQAKETSVDELNLQAAEAGQYAKETSLNELKLQAEKAGLLVGDIILKNYLTKLTDLEVKPLDMNLMKIKDIRLFRIDEMVYQSDEYSTYKFASVLNSVQHLNCGIFVIADSNGEKTHFYMGTRETDSSSSTARDTLSHALRGHFPGIKTEYIVGEEDKKKVLDPINENAKNIAAVSCVANNKDKEFKDNKQFIQGLEKLAVAMQGESYTAIILAKSISDRELTEIRGAYETIYTQLSPFANTQLNHGKNNAISISEAYSSGITKSMSHTTSSSTQTGSSTSVNKTTSVSETEPDKFGLVMKAAAITVIGVAATVATGGAAGPIAASAAATAAIPIAKMVAIGAVSAIPLASKTKGNSESIQQAENESETTGISDAVNEGTNESKTTSDARTIGTTEGIQLTIQNKTIINTLERIDTQLKRINECESLGMWECAAYFLANTSEAAEMAAGTYRALMRGENSGVETSAINFWGRGEKTPKLLEYVTNFVHPVFEYPPNSMPLPLPVTAASLVSGNELAIHMGLPRKSVCGFPVAEHADFGKEVVTYGRKDSKCSFVLGEIFNMGSKTETEVRLDCKSLTMHTFVTGSTGSGKSNTIYEILYSLMEKKNEDGEDVRFLVIEPAKGEYKNVVGHIEGVSVYGTNPQKTGMLRINPFSFPDDIHVLEHLDRLVEIFNVCWPMYSAMPAILKDALEKAYVEAGWDIVRSKNPKGRRFPGFVDLLEQLKTVINNSEYSAELKGNYSGALCTRVNSLTNGLNGMIFTTKELSGEDLFDKNVVVDLSRVGSTETKSLIMGLLVMKLNEYRMSQRAVTGKTNSNLRHVTVLEEAHNLLKRTSTEQSAESSNLAGKSVEMLANSIAEMRTYGEGFIIADQSPGLLDMSVIRNTNTKIIMRLPEQSDRELVGRAANLNDEQIKELSKLECGVAAVYQNDWIEPVLVKVNKCDGVEKQYAYDGSDAVFDTARLNKHLINFLIQGRVNEKLDFDVDWIKANLDSISLTLPWLEFIEQLIVEYKETNWLQVWENNNFKKLSQTISKLLGVRDKVNVCARSAADNTSLSEMLSDIVRCQYAKDASRRVTMVISQCLMRDFSTSNDESVTREKIYKNWFESVKKG